MTRHYPDLGSASDMVVPCVKFASTNQTYYLDLCSDRHQYGISTPVSQTSFGGETSGGVAKCRLFSQAKLKPYEI